MDGIFTHGIAFCCDLLKLIVGLCSCNGDENAIVINPPLQNLSCFVPTLSREKFICDIRELFIAITRYMIALDIRIDYYSIISIILYTT